MSNNRFKFLATALFVALAAGFVSGEDAKPRVSIPHGVHIFPLSTTDISSYSPNLCYRCNPATGEVAAVATATYAGGASQGSEPSNGIDWNPFSHWSVRFPAGAPDATAALTVDLGRVFFINCTHLFMDNAARSKTYQILGSADGTNFNLELVGPRENAPDFSGTCNDKFPAVAVRSVRLILTGACTPAQSGFTVRQFEVFAADSGPPLTTRDGFAAFDLPGVSQINASNNWKGFGNVLHYQLDSSRWDPAGATSDAIGVIDLGAVEPLAAIYLGFCGPDHAWQHGGKVELSTDNSTWTTLFETSSRLGSGKIPMTATDARYIRVTDRYDGGIGTGLLGAVLPILASDGPAPIPLANVTTPGFRSNFSAAVFDRSGRLLRHLLMASPQEAQTRIDLYWDGRDARGHAMPREAAYEVRTIASRVSGAFDGVVGNTAPLPYNWKNSPPVYTTGLATDPDGNWYTSSPGDEDAQGLRKMKASDGSAVWTIAGLPLAPGVSADGTYVYTSGCASMSNTQLDLRLYRWSASNGSPAPFNGKKTNFVPYANSKSASIALASDHDAGLNFTRVWCLLKNELEVFNGNTGELIGSPLVLTEPQGLAIQNAPSAAGPNPEKPGALWISFAGGIVQKFAWTIDPNGVPSIKATEIKIASGLTDPRGLAVGGPRSCLYVTDAGAPERDSEGKLHGTIKLYDVTGAPVLVEQFGTMQNAGAVTATSFLWKGSGFGKPSIAVNRAGQVMVTDIGQGRVQWLNADRTLFKTYVAEGVAVPTISHITATTYDVYSMGRLYRVNARDKSWSLVGNYRSSNGLDWGLDGGWIRTIHIPGVGPRDYLFCWEATDTWIGKSHPLIGMSVYALEEGGARLCAIVCGADFGLSAYDGHTYHGREVWTDLNGSGAFDPGEWSTDPACTQGNCGYQEVAMVVDETGNIWIGDFTDSKNHTLGSVVELPVSWVTADNGKISPKYDWTQRKDVVPSPSESEPVYRNNNFESKSARTWLPARLSATSINSVIFQSTSATATAWRCCASPTRAEGCAACSKCRARRNRRSAV